MFIPLHVLTVISVLFLIVLVLFALRGRSGRRDLLEPPAAGMPPSLPANVDGEVRTLIRAGEKIEAIKLVRTAAGLDLKEAKQLVERMEREW